LTKAKDKNESIICQPFLGRVTLTIMNIEEYDKIVEFLNHLLTAVGVVIGAFWTYHLFVKNRQKYPKAEIEHKIEIRDILDENFQLITLLITVKNISQILLPVEEYSIEIFQILPAIDLKDKNEKGYFNQSKSLELPNNSSIFKVTKKTKSNMEIEPTEKVLLAHSVVVPKGIQTISVHSVVHNPSKSKKQFVWNNITTHDLISNQKNN
jgi:hypothetical protein